jgi:cyclophilin family peptidyl-prolyl cis-trans isomerase
MTISPDKDYYATFRTEKGPIRIKLFADKAPETVNNFVFLAREGYFDGTTFHRIIKDLEAKVEEIAQELSGLESQHQDATSQIRRAEQKFAQLEAQRIELAPRAFAGDEKA